MKQQLIFILLAAAFPEPAFSHDLPSHVIVSHTKGPNWPAGKKVAFDDPEIQKHARYWAKQVAIQQGGPFEGTFDDIMLLKPGVSLEEAKKIAAEGPAVKSGMLKAETRRWLLFIPSPK